MSSFSQSRSTPRVGASRAASSSGVEPTGSDRAGAASTGQQLQVAPDARRSPRDRLVRQRGRDHRQVVGHLERPETGRTDVRQGDRLGEAAVATGHADEARGCVVGRRTGVVVVGGVSVSVVMAWSPGVRGVARRGDRYGRTSLIASRGLRRVPLSRRRTCPELAPCRHRAGRLSWLQRAGPSATLDKRSSVVRRCYGRSGAIVKAMRATRRERNPGGARAQPSRHRSATSTVGPVYNPALRDCGSRLLRCPARAPHHARPVDS